MPSANSWREISRLLRNSLVALTLVGPIGISNVISSASSTEVATQYGTGPVAEVYAIDQIFGSEKPVGIATPRLGSNNFLTLRKLISQPGFSYYLRDRNHLLHEFQEIARQETAAETVVIHATGFFPPTDIPKTSELGFITANKSLTLSSSDIVQAQHSTPGCLVSPKLVHVPIYRFGESSALHQKIGGVFSDAGAPIVYDGKIVGLTRPITNGDITKAEFRNPSVGHSIEELQRKQFVVVVPVSKCR